MSINKKYTGIYKEWKLQMLTLNWKFYGDPHIRLYCRLMSEKNPEQLHNYILWKKLSVTVFEFKHSVKKIYQMYNPQKVFSPIIQISLYNFIRKSEKKVFKFDW